MIDHKPRPKFLRRQTPAWVDTLIALCAGTIIGIVLFFNL